MLTLIGLEVQSNQIQIFTSPRFVLQPAIWTAHTTYSPEPSDVLGFLVAPQDFQRQAFRAATLGIHPPPQLHLSGDNLDELAVALRQRLETPTHGQASGEGVERELMTVVLAAYALNVFWREVGNDYVMPRASYPDTPASAIPPQHLVNMQSMGAVCGLMVINGQMPPRLSPFVLQYLIHHGNLDSLCLVFTWEWYPELAEMLTDWLETGPGETDLVRFRPHFINQLDVDPSVFSIHDNDMHQHLAAELLHRATLGPVAWSCAELQRFNTGFHLFTRANFTLPALGRSFEGGSEVFISLLSTSRITNADSLIPILDVACPDTFRSQLFSLRLLTGNNTITFQDIFEAFLHAVGTPCPTHFAEGTGAFHRIVDLSTIDTPAFRAKMLCWVMTGSPFLDPTIGPVTRLEIIPIHDTDPEYVPANSRTHQAVAGTIQFRTCFHRARFPIEYLLDLARTQYNGSSGPASFQEACDFWILQQSLLAIGRHNMV
ncbi:hypothetical protein C8F01DRAFT_1280805 [Mycena amicta]|nr:hypothetical protein C8F01DRAFT_1280805 [Mycena amicta]